MLNSLINCALSPCPYDTFIFCKVKDHPLVRTHLHDIETLNRLAFEGRFEITKLSFHAWLLLQERYALLDVGAALGRGCGPLVIARSADELHAGSRIAVPGEYTTAHLLLRLWRPDIEHRVFMPFDRIMDAVATGAVDAGVIIHEGRFVYRSRGFHCLQDLGTWWESTTGRPIPLGCIAARKDIGREVTADFRQLLKESVAYAMEHPESTKEYVRAHAQELSEEVMREHISTYVNAFTRDLGPEGHEAIRVLQELAGKAGVIP